MRERASTASITAAAPYACAGLRRACCLQLNRLQQFPLQINGPQQFPSKRQQQQSCPQLHSGERARVQQCTARYSR
jgi:hypothetical protein